MDARLRGSDGWRGGALGGAKLAARCDRRTGWRGGMERGGASTGGTAALIRTRPQWWLWGCAVRAFGPWRGAAGRAMPALPWTSSQWWPWGCAVRASGPRLGAAGRGAAVRVGGQWWGIRISACRTVSLSVLCMNTKGKSRFCRQPARGCGQGALVSGQVGPLVDGRWGPWVLSPALGCCYAKAVGLSRDRTRALMWSNSAGRSSIRLSRGEIRKAAWDRGSGVAVIGHGARGGSHPHRGPCMFRGPWIGQGPS